MSLFSTSFRTSLPLRKRGIYEKSQDWVTLWEKWAAHGPAVLFESGGQALRPGVGLAGEANRWLILAGNPETEFWGRNGEKWLKDASGTHSSPFDIWNFLDEIGKSEAVDATQGKLSFSPFPFCLSNAWFGILSYDFGRNFTLKTASKKYPESFSAPDYYFFKPKSVIAFDRFTKEWYLFGEETPGGLMKTDLPGNSFQVCGLKNQLSLPRYESMVRKTQAYIAKGDIYQANLAQAFQAQWKGNPASLYRVLREINPGPFMGLFHGRDFTVVSSSPERLVAGRGDWLETRPIAGTRPRGKERERDLQLEWELKTNSKEQAEHLMLVDLARNDLGRVARYGSVEVKSFAEVESYARVHHLVSVIQAQRRPSASISNIIKSLFPGGTITGCPKIRCIEIIEELEPRPRGYYTGSMGYVAAGSCFDFNILIRTFTLFVDGSLEFYAGAGIVADSDPGREYMETLYKVEALAQALGTSLVSNL